MPADEQLEPQPTAPPATMIPADEQLKPQLEPQPETRLSADEMLNSQPVEGAIRRVNPSAMSVRSSMVGLRTAKHASDDEYGVILKRLSDQKLRRNSVFLTSVKPGDGATTTAANLAGALRRRDASVLLVELRLTEPSLLRMLGSPPEVAGLEEALLANLTFDECVFELGEGSLKVLAVKTALSDDEAAQLSGPLNDLLVWAEDQFDWVVLDCPPVTSASWTRWFALNADPALLVARAGDTRMGDLRRAAASLKDHLAGVVLNDSRVG